MKHFFLQIKKLIPYISQELLYGKKWRLPLKLMSVVFPSHKKKALKKLYVDNVFLQVKCSFHYQDINIFFFLFFLVQRCQLLRGS